MNVLSLFAGIGGMDLGLERAGMRVVGQVEIDPYCQRVLRKHWPEVPLHDDVHTAAQWWGAEARPVVDVVAGGFPCQPVSDAGQRLAQQDPRWLWPAMRDVVADTRPRWVIGENVFGLRSRGLDGVMDDLAALGYVVSAGTVSACEMGATQSRRRLFILAHTEGEGWHARRDAGPVEIPATRDAVRMEQSRPARRAWWAVESTVDRVAYGVPAGVDRRRALGNAVVPAVAEHIGRLVLAGEAHHSGAP